MIKMIADVVNLHSITLARIAENKENVNIKVQEVSGKAASTAAVRVFMDKVDLIDTKMKSLDEWAGDIAEKADSDTLWCTFSERDQTINRLQGRIEALESEGVSRPWADPLGGVRAKIDSAVQESVGEIWSNITEMWTTVQELEEWISWSVWPSDEEKRQKKASDTDFPSFV